MLQTFETTSNPLHKTFRVSKEEKEELKRQGVKISKGRWTRKEIRQLDKNVARVVGEKGWAWFQEFILPAKKSCVYDCEFLPTFAEGLDRDLPSVLQKISREFNYLNYIGKYTEEETEELKRLHQIHGNKWQLIGKLMDRSAKSVEHKISGIRNDTSRGRWTMEEVERLQKAINKFGRASDGSYKTKGIPWIRVSDYVRTRSPMRCRHKWLFGLPWRAYMQETNNWSRENGGILILYLIDMGYEDEFEIDWDKLVTDLKLDVPTQFVKSRFGFLKRSVPKHHLLELGDVLQRVRHSYKWLQKRLRKRKHWRDLLLERDERSVPEDDDAE